MHSRQEDDHFLLRPLMVRATRANANDVKAGATVPAELPIDSF